MDYSTYSPSSNLFSECEHPFIDNPIVFTEPAVSRAWLLLRPGFEPYPSNKQCMLNKIVLDSCWVLLKYSRSDRKALLTGWLFRQCGLIYLIIYWWLHFIFPGTIGAVGVGVEVQQKGATLNSDFIASGSTRRFADKDNSSQSVIVSIKGDDIPEPDEEIVIKLVNPTGGARVATGMYCKAKQCYTEECISALFITKRRNEIQRNALVLCISKLCNE